MRKLLVLLFALITAISFAQLSKGNLLTGGALSFSSSKIKNPNGSGYTSTQSDIAISPRIGLFVSGRSVIGLEPGYQFTKDKFDYVDSPATTDKQSVFSIAPFYRYYFPLGEKMAFFLHGKVGISAGKSNQHYTYLNPTTGLVSITEQKSKLIEEEISLTPGLVFFITPKLSIETTISSLNYRYSKVKPEEGDHATFNTFGLRHNTFSFGIGWYLSK